MYIRIATLASLLLTSTFAGPKFTFDDGKRSLEIQQVHQIWSVLTFDPQRSPSADPRGDLFLRRSRLTFKGLAYTNLDYQFGFAVDNVAKDSLSGVGGTPQLPAATTFQAIDAAAWFHTPSDRIVLAAGLMVPHLNRELFASFPNIPSLDQANTYSYVRDHFTTRNTARETGLSLASTGFDTTSHIGYTADIGAFDNSWDRSATAATPTVAVKWSPLLTARLALQLGVPETKGWKLTSDNSTRTTGKGATLGIFGAWKGETETKSKKDSTGTGASKVYTWSWLGGSEGSDVWGADAFVWAYGATLQAEWVELGTTFGDSVRKAAPAAFKKSRIADHAFTLRGSWIAPIEFLGKFEPTVSWSRFLADNASPRYAGGRDEILDAGLNWLFDGNKTKISLHYINNNGSPTTSFTSAPSKSGFIRRSDSWVLGLQLQI